MKRPTFREIDRRLKEAKEALKKKCVAFANPGKVVGELMNLGIGPTDEIWDLILKLIDEIDLRDYKGTYPPLKSYESKIQSHDLWAFSWYSNHLKKQMYLKFCIKGGIFYYVSLHKSKYPEG